MKMVNCQQVALSLINLDRKLIERYIMFSISSKIFTKNWNFLAFLVNKNKEDHYSEEKQNLNLKGAAKLKCKHSATCRKVLFMKS